MTNQHSMTAPNALVVECMNQFLARGGGLGKLKDIVEIAFQAGADAAFQAGAEPYRAMCAELLLFSEEAGEICYNESLWPSCDQPCTLQDRARALLAQTESKGPGLKDQPLEQLVCALSYQEKKRLALNPNTAAETLTVLATDKDSDVRWRVAFNLNTAAETLTVLATDEDWGVRCGVARNLSTPVEILKILTNDEDWDVRYNVARNPNTPLEALPND